MKNKIFKKLLVFTTILSIIPLIILGATSFIFVQKMENTALNNINTLEQISFDDSTDALNHLGEEMIALTAIQIAKEVELYLEGNPMTMEELQNDENFKQICSQKVGETGYIAIVSSRDGTIYFHPQEKLINFNAFSLKDKLPEWYKIFSYSVGDTCRDSKGYYNWAESDGSIRAKYMYQACVDAQTTDDKHFFVAATTYIDEFNRPAAHLQAKIDKKRELIENSLAKSTTFLQNMIIILILIMSMLVLIASNLYAGNISRPIKKLTIATKQVAEGNFEKKEIIKSNDEIGILSSTFTSMTEQLAAQKKKIEQNQKDLEKKVEQRTKELQEKNSELDKFNKLAVGRELKMIELKKRVEELEKKKHK